MPYYDPFLAAGTPVVVAVAAAETPVVDAAGTLVVVAAVIVLATDYMIPGTGYRILSWKTRIMRHNLVEDLLLRRPQRQQDHRNHR